MIAPKWNERFKVDYEMEQMSLPCRFIGNSMTGQYVGNLKTENDYTAMVLWDGGSMLDTVHPGMIEVSIDGVSWIPLEKHITKNG